MKKQLIAFFLAVTMICGICFPAAAIDFSDPAGFTKAVESAEQPKTNGEAKVLLTKMGELLKGILVRFLPADTQGPLPNPLQAWIDMIPDDPPFEVKFTIAGDCMLATYKGEVRNGSFSSKALEGNWEYFLDGVDEYFEADDFTIVNLENVLTDSKVSPVQKNHSPAYWFKAPTENTKILTAQSVEVVNLANNHTGDYGQTGRTDTIKAVENAGLLWGNNDKTLYVEKNGFRIAMIFHGLWSEGQAGAIVDRIEAAKENSDFQIVYYHGGKERLHTPEEWKQRASRKLVDAGADLVIGNHPHVLQPMEIYKDVPIIYSMGNFCYGGSSRPENRTILYQYTLTVDPASHAVLSAEGTMIPCYVYTGAVNNYQPSVITDEAEKQKVLDFMSWDRESPM